jgi:BirA family transcriptional regulator, biotin operon repressor / biotin---[acetyl-CoA-carboxylase] ligase
MLCGMHPALDVTALRGELAGVVGRLDVVERTGSTNADLLAAARDPRDPAPDRAVLVAEHQDAGRGRLDRRWTSPPRAGITVSVLWRPDGVPPHRLGWLPLLAGVAVVDTLRAAGPGVAAALKWPNDLLVGPDGAKCAGLLAEAAPGAPGQVAVVLGIGLNVRTTREELPEGVHATSLLAEGLDVDRGALLVALLRRLLAEEAGWRDAGGDPDGPSALRERYRAVCATLGQRVRVQRPGAEPLVGTARDVDADGRLLVAVDGGTTHPVAAGDVVHLRAIP